MIAPLSPFAPLAALILLAVVALPFFLPGTWLVLRLRERLDLPVALLPLASIAANGLIGYAAFWCYFASRGLGLLASAALVVASALSLILPGGRRPLRALCDPDLRIPLLAIVCAAFAYTNLYLGVLPDPIRPNWSWTRHAVATKLLPAPDNVIPLAFAERLYWNRDSREPLFRDRSSDRPPLQAGIALVQYPLWDALRRVFSTRDVTSACYQVLGVLLQASWMAAAWALLRGLGFGVRASGGVLLALAPTFFFFFNGVYVWPKLMAGSFVVGTFCLLFVGHPRARVSPARMRVAAAFAALGLLAHSGVATSLLGLSLILLLPAWFPGVRNGLRGAWVCALLLPPWLAYQRFYDPPGNRLAKIHLAGAIEPDQRTTFEAVRDTYAELTLPGFLDFKWRGLRFVLGVDRNEAPAYDAAGSLRALRLHQMQQLGPSLGLLNVGWLVVLWGLWRAPPAEAPRWRRLAGVLVVGLFCTGVWLGVQISWPLVQHASYATAILLFVGLAAALVSIPPVAGVPLLAANAALSVAAVLAYPVSRCYAFAPLVAAAVGYAALAFMCLRTRIPQPEAAHEV